MTQWRFGIIGCGDIAERHVEAIGQIEDAKLIAVSSRTESRARAIAEREGCEWYADYRELLGRGDIDIVCVTTSSGSHAAIGLDALNAGKHLIVEKPMAMSARDARRMVDAARERGLVLSSIAQRRFEANNQLIKRVLDAGGLGRLLLAEMTLPFYRTQAYYDSAEWRGTIAEDGGALMNQGIHGLDLLLWFAGDARTVFGKTATLTHRMEAEDLGLAILQFESGAYGTVMASTSVQPGYPATVSLYGETGTIKLEGSSIVRWAVPGWEQPNWAQEQTYGGVTDPKSIVTEFHQSQFLDVIAAIETGTEPLSSGEDGWRAVRLVESIYESANRRTEIAIGEDQAKERVE
ncbi:Gfo/Idh/MocA family protein [Cohnella rhizosphaerae]|uniref:Gfo/Idh/MocA family oxidoreductase n=1 Tax=Cohnella rhizosphaerae TaxID=1457232 RepID=A0A9X4QT81_9BACL|nr:Gfo/Idh/MocA family oxidoreductase [Cohnella rhizosphaerae]MDG0810104.1 Gfo/Idh/MocA family oxidoreductase [Cohnella rhizosphaerae]